MGLPILFVKLLPTHIYNKDRWLDYNYIRFDMLLKFLIRYIHYIHLYLAALLLQLAFDNWRKGFRQEQDHSSTINPTFGKTIYNNLSKPYRKKNKRSFTKKNNSLKD